VTLRAENAELKKTLEALSVYVDWHVSSRNMARPLYSNPSRVAFVPASWPYTGSLYGFMVAKPCDVLSILGGGGG
jgi:hypothetical protein